MAKRKYPSELNSRTVRVNIGDWHWLNSLSKSLGITVAEAFHKVVTGQDHKAKAPEPAQIPMPTFTVMSQPVLAIKSQPVITTNGHKAGVFVIKPKGGILND